MERDYEEIFQKVLDYEQTLHEKNRKRIKIGLKCIWIVPLFFLALLFLTGSNKVIFLILWIVSLFALSIYLIVVEYMDYNLQEKIMELKGEEGTIEAVTPADFDRAAQIIRKTREMIGEGLNSPAETQAEVTEKKDEAEEIKENNPKVLAEINEYFAGQEIEVEFVSHVGLKEMTKECKAVIRTGETTPYANIILQSGCIF